ncbi:unnamed protein product [Effrenium voratum]|nr:unnamed protein product [Effrenium voratum]
MYGGYGRGMYGGYGGGMYGGYGGGMYGGGMYGGMGMGAGMGSSYAESMFRMTQMLEMNSIMLEQLQEHVTMTFYRLRDVVEWVWALKSSSAQDKEQLTEESDPNKRYVSKEARDVEMDRIRRRCKALLALFGLFLFLIFRDNRRQKRRLLDETSWLQITQSIARPASSAMAAASAAMSNMGMSNPGMANPSANIMSSMQGMMPYGSM